MKRVNFNCFVVSLIMFIVLCLAMTNCIQNKNENYKVLHLIPYGYEGYIIAKGVSSIERNGNSVYNELHGDTIVVKYNEDGIGNFNLNTDDFISIDEEMVYWIDSSHNFHDSIMFVNYGTGFHGVDHVYLVTRKEKDEFLVDKRLKNVKKERLHDLYPPILDLNNLRLIDTIEMRHADLFTIDNKLIWTNRQ